MGKLQLHELLTDQFEERPQGTVIDTVIIHSMHNPESEDMFSAVSCLGCLDSYGVSTHYIIDLHGKVWCCVPEEKKAWHAGVSKMPGSDGREGVNAFSIGIELVGTEDTDFTDAQYQSLALLTEDILSRRQISSIFGHSDVAPDRKTDPWGFDWRRYRKDITRLCPNREITFCNVAYS